MKKLLVGAFLGMFAVAGVAVLPNIVAAQDDEGGSVQQGGGGGDEGTDSSAWANPNANKNLIGNQTLTGSKFLDTVKNAINWILGILATVALVMCLYGGFKMVTAAEDEKKYQDGVKVLKYAAIGLAVVGLSWMIVSVIFWFVGSLSGDSQTRAGSVGTSTNNEGSILGTSD